MAMNTKKVLLGGLAAGVVLNIIDYVVLGIVLADRMKTEADAFKPGTSALMNSGGAMKIYIITDFVLGILLVWTYAAIRPRFGPGLRTASAAAILFWLLGSLFTVGYIPMGLMSRGLWWTYGIIWLVNLLIASWVGGWVYSEDTATASAV
jgi:hypothetical protein